MHFEAYFLYFEVQDEEAFLNPTALGTNDRALGWGKPGYYMALLPKFSLEI